MLDAESFKITDLRAIARELGIQPRGRSKVKVVASIEAGHPDPAALRAAISAVCGASQPAPRKRATQKRAAQAPATQAPATQARAGRAQSRPGQVPAPAPALRELKQALDTIDRRVSTIERQVKYVMAKLDVLERPGAAPGTLSTPGTLGTPGTPASTATATTTTTATTNTTAPAPVGSAPAPPSLPVDFAAVEEVKPLIVGLFPPGTSRTLDEIERDPALAAYPWGVLAAALTALVDDEVFDVSEGKSTRKLNDTIGRLIRR